MELLHNPFLVLGANEFSSREEILSLSELQSLSLAEEECNEARLTLLNPRRRLEAEVGWIFALPASQRPYVIATPSLELSNSLQAQASKITEFLAAAVQWKQEHTSQALVSRETTGKTLQGQLAKVIHVTSEISKLESKLQHLDDLEETSLHEDEWGDTAHTFQDKRRELLKARAKLNDYPLFVAGTSYTWKDVEHQNADPASQKIKALGQQLLVQLSQVETGLAALSKINLLTLMLECTEVYPIDLSPDWSQALLATKPSLQSASSSELRDSFDAFGKLDELDTGSEPASVSERADYVLQLSVALEQLTLPKIMTVINQARKQAGFNLIIDLAALEEVIEERQHQVIHAVISKLSKLSYIELAQYLTQLILAVKQYDPELARNSRLLRALIELYAMQSQELFAHQRSWRALPEQLGFGHTEESLYRLELPFIRLRLSWWLDYEPWQIDGALQEVYNTSLAWINRLRPLIVWYDLTEQSLEQIESLLVLEKLWASLTGLWSDRSVVFYRAQDAMRFGLVLLKDCGSLAEDFQSRVHKVLSESGPWINGMLRKGKSLVTCEVLTDLSGCLNSNQSSTEALHSSQTNALHSNYVSVSSLQRYEVTLYENVLQIDKLKVPLGNVAVMHYDSIEDLELIVLKDHMGTELIVLGFEQHQDFLMFVQSLALRLCVCKFGFKYLLHRALKREIHLGRLRIRQDDEAVIYNLSDLETEQICNLKTGQLFAQDAVTLGYRRKRGDDWTDAENQPLEFKVATFREFDNLPIFLAYLQGYLPFGSNLSEKLIGLLNRVAEED